MNSLRATPALKAIAAVMSGLDPEPTDLAVVGEQPVDAQAIHLATAIALRRMLLSRPLPNAQLTPIDSEQQVLLDAYYLALSLAGRTIDAIPAPRVTAAPAGDNWLKVTSLVGSMQVRFLESVCSQIAITADVPSLSVGTRRVPIGKMIPLGAELASGTSVLGNYTNAPTRDGQSPWLHATSTITVAGMAGPAVVDAGPDTFPAEAAVRLAAPVAVVAAEGRWPKSVVDDCLRICARSVRSWVASMARHLGGDSNQDLVIHPLTPLRDHLVSPATATLTETGADPEALPLRPGPIQDSGISSSEVAELLATLRFGGEPGSELPADTHLDGAVQIAHLRPDELALLAASPTSDIEGGVVVTVNFEIPEWLDASTVLSQVRETGALTLTHAALGWIDRDVVAGRTRRLSLRARVCSGVVCETGRGQAVLLPAGTRITLIGSDTGRSHSTLYGVQNPEAPRGGVLRAAAWSPRAA